MIKNIFDFSLLDGAPKGALIACRPEENGEAILVVRQSDAGVDDYRLRGHEDFFPVSMALASRNGDQPIEIKGGDWTTIPYVRQAAEDYDGLYRSYTLHSIEKEMEEAQDRAADEKIALNQFLSDEEERLRERKAMWGEEVDNDSE